MKRNGFRLGARFSTVLAFAAGAVIFAGSNAAHARDGSKTVVALDLDFAASIDEPSTDAGGGGALRFGRKIDLLVLSLTPEVGGAYHGFGGDAEPKLYNGFVGARLGLGKIIEPSVFAHLGLGRLEAAAGYGRTSPTFDAGLALDFTLLPLIDLGVHGSYNTVFGDEDESAFDWYALGLHAALVF